MGATLAGGRYRLERPLGSGGMAVVYLAEDEELRRPVAVKVLAENLAEDPDFRARFLREARVAARLSHANVVGVYDAGEEEGRPFIVMELVHGETLAGVLARRGRLPAAEVVELGVQAASGLGHAHGRGLVHRDVKPHNLLLREDGALKVADFGIARAATSTQRLTQVGTVLGTAAYLAPEQASGGDVTAAADVYSLGVVLYEALTGRQPYEADTLGALVTAQQQDAIRPVRELAPEVPPALEEVVMRCLARNPDYRPAPADEVARLLAASTGGEAPTVPLAPPPSGQRHRLPRPGKRPLAMVATLAAAGAIAAGVAAIAGGGSSIPPPPPDRPGHLARQASDLAAWLRDAAG